MMMIFSDFQMFFWGEIEIFFEKGGRANNMNMGIDGGAFEVSEKGTFGRGVHTWISVIWKR